MPITEIPDQEILLTISNLRINYLEQIQQKIAIKKNML